MSFLLGTLLGFIRQAHAVYVKQDLLVPSLMSKGIDFSASSLAMVAGTPIPPMLAR